MELTQTQAEGILLITMAAGKKYGWTLPEFLAGLGEAHARAGGEPRCNWIPRPDLMRWQCVHGLFVKEFVVSAQVGSWRN